VTFEADFVFSRTRGLSILYGINRCRPAIEQSREISVSSLTGSDFNSTYISPAVALTSGAHFGDVSFYIDLFHVSKFGCQSFMMITSRRVPCISLHVPDTKL
jgi:hypothetical protein